MDEFKQFDIVSDVSDHYFRDRSKRGNITDNANKSIMKEWKILEQNLPDSIYVRVYEGRIDLMRAAIIGVAGTPYHDGLFFIDIAFPSDYPNKPPKVYFISFGLELNSYLNSEGKLCLSLLNTMWFGRKSERWNPSMSTILQLLLSLQALVLTKKPALSWLESNARFYVELVYRNTCQLTVHLLQRPPKNFESFIKGHFRDRAMRILAAFTEYATGRVSIGYYGPHAQLCSPPRKVSVSLMHKRWAEKFYPCMINEFERCGASLDTSVHSLVLPSESDNKKKSTILTKVKAQINKSLMI